MNHADFLHEQIVKLAPTGVDETSRDPESGSDRRWYRVRVPHLRELLKQWKSEHGSGLTFDEWSEVVDDLYHRDSLDERAFAGMIVAGFPTFRRQISLGQLERWLGQLEGWKEVDNTCQSGFSAEDMLSNWKAWSRFLKNLSQDENIHKRRACLVLLVKPLRAEEEDCFLELAFELIEALKHEKHKLITKAISWVLRSATKHHHGDVRRYVNASRDSLPAIAVRETARKLDTGKK